MKNLFIFFGKLSSQILHEKTAASTSLSFFSNRHGFVRTRLSRFPPQNSKYINERDFLSLFSLQPDAPKTSCKLDFTISEGCWSAWCQQLHLKDTKERHTPTLAPKLSMRARLIGMKVSYLATTPEWRHAAETRVKEKARYQALLRSSSSPTTLLPSRYTRVHNMYLQ